VAAIVTPPTLQNPAELTVTTGFALMVTGVVVLLQPVAVAVKVNITLPGATPVITPPLVTVANSESLALVLHIPPVVGDSVAVLPAHKLAGAVTVGDALMVTVTGLMSLQPPGATALM
jgi:hypothetical protein